MAPRIMTTAIALALALALGACGSDASAETPGTIDVKLGGKAFTLEVAVTREQVERGLMGREHLANDGGMIFVFDDQQVRRFWMKNCLMDLDIVFVDNSGRIVAIHTMRYPRTDEEKADPPYYSSGYPARFAIELNAGEAGRLGLQEGQELGVDVERIKRLAD